MKINCVLAILATSLAFVSTSVLSAGAINSKSYVSPQTVNALKPPAPVTVITETLNSLFLKYLLMTRFIIKSKMHKGK
jgi:hypothetical protein